MNAKTPSAFPNSSRTPASKARLPTSEAEGQPPKNEIPLSEASDQTDFFMVLEGQCFLNLHVKITFDQSDSLRYIAKKMRHAELETDSLESSRESATRGVDRPPDSFLARFRLPKFAIINDETISKYHIDFVEFFQEQGGGGNQN